MPQSSLHTLLAGNHQILLHQAQSALQVHQGDALRAATQLRKQIPDALPELCSAALELSLLREKAQQRGYGAWAINGFFTRQSLEQATTPAIAAYHAARFAGCKHVVEICTGAGFDTAALAQAVKPHGGRVTSIEADSVLAECARRNLTLQGIDNVEIVCGRAEDVVGGLPLETVDGLWCDPSRRSSAENQKARRIEHPDAYHPALSFVQSLALKLRGDTVCGIKIAPAVTLEEVYINGWMREWVGVAGECREQVLWRISERVSEATGIMKLCDGTVSLVDASAVWQPPFTKDVEPQAASVLGLKKVPQGWLIEPHPALIRCGHLATFFAERDMAPLDEHIAYGIASETPPESPFYQTFHILEAFPYNRKSLQERVNARHWGTRTEIKKRGFPESPETVRSWLRLKDSLAFGVVILTRRGSGSSEQHWALLAERGR
jgi:hypothetical protein